MSQDAVTVPAHAKLNLFLRVLAREADGYHGIETLFCLVSLADTLIAERRGERGISIQVAGADVGPPKENLAVRAAAMVLEATGHRFGVHLALEKRIPVQGGLGGGSSDAAAALVAVNRLAGNAVPRHELLQFAGRLGSDVAVALDLDALSRWGDIGRMAGNDFESAVFARVPEVRAAFEALVRTRPLVCRMSGSGSTLFAVYRSARDRDDARSALGRKHGRVDAVETLAAPPG